MFCKLWIFFFVCSLEIADIFGQASIGTTCTTPDKLSGTCTLLDNCPPLLHLVLTQNKNITVRSYLRAAVCEYSGQNPVVCCPNQVSTTEYPTNGSPTNNQRIKLPQSPNCGFTNVSIPRIVNGVPAKLGEFPWIVALGYRNAKNPNLPKWLCGGSLITNKHVLTAAHCVYNRNDLYMVRLGDLDLFSDEDGAKPSTMSIAKVYFHKNFNSVKRTNDIAILKLTETVNNPTVWPICLPIIEPFKSMSYLNFQPTLAGWGSVSFGGPTNSMLQQIFVPVLNNQVCERQFGRVATIDSTILCAGSLNGDKDACGGDSGGPLMHDISEGDNFRVYQIGIVSYGFRCATPNFPGVYTRVTAYLDWIQENLD